MTKVPSASSLQERSKLYSRNLKLLKSNVIVDVHRKNSYALTMIQENGTLRAEPASVESALSFQTKNCRTYVTKLVKFLNHSPFEILRIPLIATILKAR